MGIVFTSRIWAAREELSARKNNIHVVLEGSHYWDVVMLEKRPICLQKWDVSL
jgi:hypothetical protein